MNLGLRPFQIILFAVFGTLLIGSFVFFVFWKPPQSTEQLQYGEQVVIWGTIPNSEMNRVLQAARDQNEGFAVVSYQQRDSRTFRDDLVDAIAEGRSPDVVILPHTELVPLRTKLFPIPYGEGTMTQRSYLETYNDGAEIFAFPEGLYALPIMVDPLVMYWNRDILASNSFVNPPRTWDSLTLNYVPNLVVRDYNRNIIQAAVAMGQYSNVKNAFAILSALTLQGGSIMVESRGGSYSINLDTSVNAAVRNPFFNAVDFYSGFARVDNPLYTWSRSQNEDRDEFAAGDVALYFGMGSEYSDIAALNPNLNFDIADFPQGAGSTAKRTYGTYYGYSILNASQNKEGAYGVIRYLLNQDLNEQVVAASNAAPVTRAQLEAGSLDPIDQVRYRSAIITRGWLSPELEQAEEIFQAMLDSLLANRSGPGEAVRDALIRLRNSY